MLAEAAMPQPLSSKERSLFAQVVKNYESKQFKKGVSLDLRSKLSHS